MEAVLGKNLNLLETRMLANGGKSRPSHYYDGLRNARRDADYVF